MNARPFSPVSAAELLASGAPARSDLLAPLIGRNSSVLVHGAPGVGKTFFALGIAWAAAAGGSFLGWQAPRPTRVLYVDAELGAEAMGERLALFGAPPPELQFFLPDRRHGPLPDLTRIEAQHELMESWGDPGLVVLDSRPSLAPLPTGGGRRRERLQRFLQRQKTYGRAMLVVDAGGRDGGPSGGQPWAGAFDLVLGLHRPRDWRPGDGACFEIAFDKARGWPGGGGRLRAQLATGPQAGACWRWTAVASPFERAAALLRQGVKVDVMAEALGVSVATAYRWRSRAQECGLLPNLSQRRPADVSGQ